MPLSDRAPPGTAVEHPGVHVVLATCSLGEVVLWGAFVKLLRCFCLLTL